MCVQQTIFSQYADYGSVPEEGIYFMKEGMTREVKFVLLNPPAARLEFVTVFTEDGEAKGEFSYS